MIFVVARGDGAVAIDGDGAPANGASLGPDSDRTPVVFHFQTPDAARAVIAGALRRLAVERVDESRRWFLDMSSGQVAATIKAEAKGLGFSFTVIHPEFAGGPVIGSGARSWTRLAASIAPYVVFTLAGMLGGMLIGFMLKGS